MNFYRQLKPAVIFYGINILTYIPLGGMMKLRKEKDVRIWENISMTIH